MTHKLLDLLGHSFNVDPFVYTELSHTSFYVQNEFDKFTASYDIVHMLERCVHELSVYANNAAAVAGNLEVGAVYKTATGELRFVV